MSQRSTGASGSNKQSVLATAAVVASSTVSTISTTTTTALAKSAGGGGSKITPMVLKTSENETLAGKDRVKPSSTVRALNFDDAELEKKKSPPGSAEQKVEDVKLMTNDITKEDDIKTKNIPNVSNKPSVVKREEAKLHTSAATTTVSSVSSKPISSPAVISASKPPHSSSPKPALDAEVKPHGSPSKGSLKKMHQQSKVEEAPKPTLLKSSSVPANASG